MLTGKYKWILDEPGPKMILEAVKLYGILEMPGTGDNPVILAWAKEVGVKDYTHDSIAWCGLAEAVVAFRAGKPVVKEPLWAGNWSKWGVEVTVAMFGDTLVARRPGGNHVCIYIGEDDVAYHVFGGNQSDRYGITRIVKGRVWAIRRPEYTIQPANVRRIILKPDGIISANEA